MRIKEANALTELITKEEFKFLRNENDGFVVLLNGGWGTGKTTFIDNHLTPTLNANSNIKKVIKYNAWENDDFDSPMITFMHYLDKEYEGSFDKVKDDLMKIVNLQKKKILHATGIFVKNTLFSVMKTKLGIDMKYIAEKVNELQESIEEEPWDSMENFEEFVQAKESFRSKLESLGKDGIIVVIIDELDRCKPDFAINTLEMIKHYFNVKNFAFVISADQVQLMESVRTLFGQNMDSDVYFSKFYDYKFNLEYLDSNVISESLGDSVMGDFYLIQSNVYDFSVREYSNYMFEKLSVSLREQTKILKELAILSAKKNWGFPRRIVFTFLMILKYTDIVMYNNVIRGEYRADIDDAQAKYIFLPEKYRFMYYDYVSGQNETIQGINHSIIILTENGEATKLVSRYQQPRKGQIGAFFGQSSQAKTIHDLIDLNMRM